MGTTTILQPGVERVKSWTVARHQIFGNSGFLMLSTVLNEQDLMLECVLRWLEMVFETWTGD
jgi:hypothetical protein